MVWYHGTPDVNPLLEKGFEQRKLSRRMVRDIDALIKSRRHATEEGLSDIEGFRRLAALADHFEDVSLPVPVFLSKSRATAASYANDKRAFDYQGADAGVLEVEVSEQAALVIDARGETFRGISWQAVKDALELAGHDAGPVLKVLTDKLEIKDISMLRVSDLGAALNICGFQVVDVCNVIDTHQGRGKPDTVRMVFSVDLLQIRLPEQTPEP